VQRLASKQAAKEAGGAEPRQPSVTPKSLKRPRTHTPPRGMLEQQQWAAEGSETKRAAAVTLMTPTVGAHDDANKENCSPLSIWEHATQGKAPAEAPEAATPLPEPKGDNRDDAPPASCTKTPVPITPGATEADEGVTVGGGGFEDAEVLTPLDGGKCASPAKQEEEQGEGSKQLPCVGLWTPPSRIALARMADPSSTSSPHEPMMALLPTPAQAPPHAAKLLVTPLPYTPPCVSAGPSSPLSRRTTPLDALAEISEVLVEKTSELAAKERVRAPHPLNLGSLLNAFFPTLF
jgi:hypothetical protein